MELLRGWQALTRAGARQPAAVTIGSFDGPHVGHRAIIESVVADARAQDLRATLVTFDPHPRAVLRPGEGPLRISRWADRVPALESFGLDCAVVLRFDAALSQMQPGSFVQRLLVDGLRARAVTVGWDFRFGHRAAGDVATLETLGAAAGFSVVVLDDRQLGGRRVSSSSIRELLGAGRLDEAAALLGRPYRISGRVVYGEQIGRTLGYRTANLSLRGWEPPVSGVFAVRVRPGAARARPRCAGDAPPGPAAASPAVPVGGWSGMANVGMRPTVGGLRRLLEVHLFDFSGNLYGQRLEVDFVAKLRGEQRFDGLDALRAQLARDAQAARTQLAGAH